MSSIDKFNKLLKKARKDISSELIRNMQQKCAVDWMLGVVGGKRSGCHEFIIDKISITNTFGIELIKVEIERFLGECFYVGCAYESFDKVKVSIAYKLEGGS